MAWRTLGGNVDHHAGQKGFGKQDLSAVDRIPSAVRSSLPQAPDQAIRGRWRRSPQQSARPPLGEVFSQTMRGGRMDRQAFSHLPCGWRNRSPDGSVVGWPNHRDKATSKSSSMACSKRQAVACAFPSKGRRSNMTSAKRWRRFIRRPCSKPSSVSSHPCRACRTKPRLDKRWTISVAEAGETLRRFARSPVLTIAPGDSS